MVTEIETTAENNRITETLSAEELQVAALEVQVQRLDSLCAELAKIAPGAATAEDCLQAIRTTLNLYERRLNTAHAFIKEHL